MFTAHVVLASVLFGVTATHAAPVENPAITAEEQGRVEFVQKQDSDEGVFDNLLERRFSFTLNDDLHPSVEDDLWPFFAGGIVSCLAGQVWCPLLVLDEKPEDAFQESIVTWLFYGIPMAVLCVPNFIPYLNFIYGPLYCVGCTVVSLYLLPVNIINAWDRQAKRYGVAAKKKKRKSSSVNERWDEPHESVGVAMAY